MNKQEKTKRNLKDYVDGDVDTPYEIFMLFVITINTISLGLETSRNITENFRNILFMIDQICLWVFFVELIFKIMLNECSWVSLDRSRVSNPYIDFFNLPFFQIYVFPKLWEIIQ